MPSIKVLGALAWLSVAAGELELEETHSLADPASSSWHCLSSEGSPHLGTGFLARCWGWAPVPGHGQCWVPGRVGGAGPGGHGKRHSPNPCVRQRKVHGQHPTTCIPIAYCLQPSPAPSVAPHQARPQLAARRGRGGLAEPHCSRLWPPSLELNAAKALLLISAPTLSVIFEDLCLLLVPLPFGSLFLPRFGCKMPQSAQPAGNVSSMRCCWGGMCRLPCPTRCCGRHSRG